MQNLNNKQKIILFIILLIMVFTILYYFIFYQNNSENYSYIEDNIENTNTISSENNQIVEEENYIIIHVAGSVKNPGIIKLKYGARIIDAIEAAGGLTEDANINDVNLAYILEDAQKLYIPNKNDDLYNGEILSSTNGEKIIDEIDSSINNNLKININTAKQTELESLPGIGPSIALKIIEYRNEHGNFTSIEDIKNVSGLGDSKFNNIKDFIFVK